MIGYIYANVTTGEIDIFPCSVEEVEPIYNSFYLKRFPIENYVFLKTDTFNSREVIYNGSPYV
jgi:hypothetical protein